jgi:hypothetical protein
MGQLTVPGVQASGGGSSVTPPSFVGADIFGDLYGVTPHANGIAYYQNSTSSPAIAPNLTYDGVSQLELACSVAATPALISCVATGTGSASYAAIKATSTNGTAFITASGTAAELSLSAGTNMATLIQNSSGTVLESSGNANAFIVVNAGRILCNTGTDNGTDQLQVNGSIEVAGNGSYSITGASPLKIYAAGTGAVDIGNVTNGNQFNLTGSALIPSTSLTKNLGNSSTFFTTTFTQSVGHNVLTVATLPASPSAGWRAFVSDALTPVFGSAVTGGGAVPVPVYYTGSTWNVG